MVTGGADEAPQHLAPRDRPGVTGGPGRRAVVAALVAGLVVVALVVGRGVLAGDGDGDGDGGDGQGDRVEQGSADEGPTGEGPTSTTAVTTTVPVTPPPPPQPPPPLPGVTAQGVVDGLSGLGWTCTGNAGLDPGHVATDCDRPSLGARAQVVATPAGEVLFVEVFGYEDRIGAFEEVASLGWTGVDAGAVATWIATTTSSATVMGPNDATFGEVTFSLVGDPASPVGNWVLQFGERPPGT
jgi:hypothetical protein